MLKIGRLYQIISGKFLYIKKYDKLAESDITPVLVQNYKETIFLYLGYQYHEDAEFGHFNKFLYENQIFYTEIGRNYACEFEEIIIDET